LPLNGLEYGKIDGNCPKIEIINKLFLKIIGTALKNRKIFRRVKSQKIFFESISSSIEAIKPI